MKSFLKIMAVAAVAMFTVATATPADARIKTHHKTQLIIRDAMPSYATAPIYTLSAKKHHYAKHSSSKHRRYARGGKCDGFQRCLCGTTAARYFNLAYDHNGMNLKMASAWRGFQHTSFHVGAAGIKQDGHHVVAVVGGTDCSNAIIHDDAGTRQRNVCGFMFVNPGSGGGGTQTASARSHQHHSRYQQLAAVSVVSSDYMSRAGAGL